MNLLKYGPNARAEGKISWPGVGVEWGGVGECQMTILTNCNSDSVFNFIAFLYDFVFLENKRHSAMKR